MDFSRFDTLARAVSTLGTRRRILGLPLGLLVASGLAVASEEETTAGRRRRRKARRSQRTRDRTCKPKPRQSICSGRCGTVKN
jgi:hypothetical protein